jgi:hypothetical protein
MATKTETTPAAFFSHTSVEKTVGDKVLKFYPVSLKAVFDLRAVAKPLVRALTTLFQGVGQENGGRSITKDHKLADGTTGVEKIEEVDGIHPDLARLKVEERQKAIHDLIDAFTDPVNAKLLVKLIMDSLRDEFPRPIKDPAVAEFQDTVDAVTFGALLTGLIEANAGVLGPLAPRLRQVVQQQQQTIGGAES